MNDPKLYSQVNALQRKDTAEVIAKFSPKLKWRSDGLDTLIDVGSGPGDVLMELFYPKIPKTFQRLVCSDVNANMVQYAQQTYQHVEKSEYRILDIAMKEELPDDLKGQFDHVTSFYCLQFVKDQRQFFVNIFNLLRPDGGDCLITSALVTIHHDIGRALSEHPKWSTYIQNSLYNQSSPNPEDIRTATLKMVQEVPFKDYSVEVRDREYIFKIEDFRNNMKAVTPVIHLVPVALKDEFTGLKIDNS